MKRLFFYILLLLCIQGLYAQPKGVDFQHLSFSEARQKAVQEKKLLFLDFYTEWCGPCKTMSKEVFPQPKVGDFFNPGFVCLKVDAEKGEGKELAGKYKIQAYPTFIVLNPDGTEVYRTSGARPADEFIEKIRKGIDPKWSPEGLTKRYTKGERSPELVLDYALYKLENKAGEEGLKILDDYYQSLSAKKRVKPENFFLYEKFTMGLADPKGEYLFEHKNDFVKANGREKIDNLLSNWLRIELIPFVTLRTAEPITEEGLQKVKSQIVQADLQETDKFNDLLDIAAVRVTGDRKRYLEVCKEKFPGLPENDRFLMLLNFSELQQETPEIKEMAADLIQDNLQVADGLNRRILKTQMYELQGKKEYSLRAQLEGAESGQVLVMKFTGRGFSCDTIPFDEHRIEFDLAGTDTLSVTLRIVSDELGSPTPSLGINYPMVSLLMVPGEFAVMKLKLEKGKIPQVTWLRGGKISRDFIRLNYEQAAPAELAYRQLSMDNIIRGGDIREYKTEFNAYSKANMQSIVSFVRNNSESYVALMNLLEHYHWFDENEIDQIYTQFPDELKGSKLGRMLKRQLDAGREFRSGKMAADFTKKDLKGKMVKMSGLRGKYVLLDFWGSWCGPCRNSHPHLKELNQKYGKDVLFINIASENAKTLEVSKENWKKAVKEDGLTWTQILNDEGKEEYDLLKLYHITAFPTKILIDPEGKIVARMVGTSLDPEEVLKQELGK